MTTQKQISLGYEEIVLLAGTVRAQIAAGDRRDVMYSLLRTLENEILYWNQGR